MRGGWSDDKFVPTPEHDEDVNRLRAIHRMIIAADAAGIRQALVDTPALFHRRVSSATTIYPRNPYNLLTPLEYAITMWDHYPCEETINVIINVGGRATMIDEHGKSVLEHVGAVSVSSAILLYNIVQRIPLRGFQAYRYLRFDTNLLDGLQSYRYPRPRQDPLDQMLDGWESHLRGNLRSAIHATMLWRRQNTLFALEIPRDVLPLVVSYILGRGDLPTLYHLLTNKKQSIKE